jgi:hypothetical protein
MVETVGNAPTAAILQGSPAPLCCPRIGARGPYRADSFAFSARRNDLICHPGLKFGAVGGIEPRVCALATRCSTIELRPQLVGRDGVEPPQTMRGVYSALGSPMPSLPEIGCRSASRTRLRTAYETARTPGLPASEMHHRIWRRAENSNLTPLGAIGFRSRAGAPVRLTLHGGKRRSRSAALARPARFRRAPATWPVHFPDWRRAGALEAHALWHHRCSKPRRPT